MVHALLVTLVVCQAGAAPAPAPAATGSDNLWLVAPLYPGQEILVGRTESAIHQLLPQGSTDLVGFDALKTLVTSRKGDMGCALGETACPSPLDAYLKGLGLAKLVLIKGGQEEPNYRFEVTSIDLTSGESRSATGTGPVLEKALLAALVKVAPLASVLKVSSTPPGLDLYVDNEKLGKTPFEGQILPGERTLKISGPGFQDLVKTITVPARGTVALDEKLQLLPSTLTIKPIQKQAAIYVDGKPIGLGDVSTQVTPGQHTVEAKLQGYQDYSHVVDVAGNGQATDIPDLKPTAESGVLQKTSYVEIGFQNEWLRKRHGTYRVNAVPFNKVNTDLEPSGVLTNPPVGALSDGATLRGVTLDWGQQQNHFGMLLIGFTYMGSSTNPNGRVYAGGTTGTFNGPTNLVSAPGHAGDFYDLHFVQPQVNFVYWHLMGYAQAGIGIRGLRVDTPDFMDVHSVKHSDGYIDIAPYANLKLAARMYVFEGAYVHASYRFTYVVSLNAPQGAWTPVSPTDGLELGLGYAY